LTTEATRHLSSALHRPRSGLYFRTSRHPTLFGHRDAQVSLTQGITSGRLARIATRGQALRGGRR
jgi:hypothetical protein